MRYLLLIIAPLLTGCICLNPAHKKIGPPIANTGRVIESLNSTKDNLAKAGESNTIVGEKIDKALTLAERLEILLQQIETEKQSADAKKVKDPIK
jgi:hypothetical protein